MDINLQELLNNNVIGNVRSGTKGDKDEPKKLAYFDVHLDKTTSSLAVEVFNQAYNNPTKLRIRFINQNPIEVCLQRYEGKRRRCYGNNKQAKFIDDNGKVQNIVCNTEKCPYAQKGECKYAARLFFLIEKLEDEGVWCYPIGSQKGIKRICTRIARANRKNEDLTKDWYELFLNAEDAPTRGKNYIPDIKKVGEIPEIHESKKEDTNKENITNSKVGKQKFDYLMLKGFQMTMFENKKAVKIKFIDTSSKESELILMPEGKQDILKLKPKSIILPLEITKTEKGMILTDYTIAKAIIEELENKKAV